jgi:hypothetical protein
VNEAHGNRPITRVGFYWNLWGGVIAFLISLAGTLLLRSESARVWAVPLLIAAAALAVIVWGRHKWIPAFAQYSFRRETDLPRRHQLSLMGELAAVVISLAAGIRYLAAPNETFGLAGFLWLIAIGLLLCSVFVGSHTSAACSGERTAPLWTNWEMVVLAAIFAVALLTRVWDLKSFPDNIYPDEIQTGTVATESYISPLGSSPSFFQTLWDGVDLPALWFWIVALFLKAGGNTLGMLRLPAALLGAATVLPLYGLIRGTWGRYAAITGAAIMSVSASNIHYSRLALNNITTQFFWAVCFFFLLRGLRSRRPSDWALAGLSAGLSEHFYYGTRLLPFILLLFLIYFLAVHWQQMRQQLRSFLLLAGSYFVGFGPLLFYFVRKPNLYYGRGASLMIWSPHIPTGLQDLGNMWGTLWPAISENLLGISTHSSQDIIFYAPLLLPAEAALLVLGTALLLWHWRHPTAFLIVASGLGVLLTGGALVGYPNSVPPLINHWTPAFPAFYAALAVPIGAWTAFEPPKVPISLRWLLPATLAVFLSVLAWLNLDFYFDHYYADPASLKSMAYRSSQQTYEIQTAESRYLASLGPEYEVFIVGTLSSPYDPVTTRYLVPNQKWTMLKNPAAEIPTINAGNKGLAFLFFPGNEQYRELIHKLCPGGTGGEATTKRGRHLFYAYQLTPAQPQSIRN